MNAAVAVTMACVGCGACLATCPETAIRVAPAGSGGPLTVLDRCTACDECIEICPVDAIVEVGR